MNRIGVHSHLFRGPARAVAEAARAHGLGCVQLTPNFPGLGFHEPGQTVRDRCLRAAEPFAQAGVAIASLGAGTILDDLNRRHASILRCHALIRHCSDFGARYLVVETGPAKMECAGRSEAGSGAWYELRAILREALIMAADYGVHLLLKPDPAHHLSSPRQALELRQDLPNPQLGFVMDPAAFLCGTPSSEWSTELRRLCASLGPCAPLIHAKDLRAGETCPSLPPAGRGGLDYELLLTLHGQDNPTAPIILEHLRPEEIGETKDYIETCLKCSMELPVPGCSEVELRAM
jgi:sugar phosphate isomerase/epimerase